MAKTEEELWNEFIRDFAFPTDATELVKLRTGAARRIGLDSAILHWARAMYPKAQHIPAVSAGLRALVEERRRKTLISIDDAPAAKQRPKEWGYLNWIDIRSGDDSELKQFLQHIDVWMRTRQGVMRDEYNHLRKHSKDPKDFERLLKDPRFDDILIDDRKRIVAGYANLDPVRKVMGDERHFWQWLQNPVTPIGVSIKQSEEAKDLWNPWQSSVYGQPMSIRGETSRAFDRMNLPADHPEHLPADFFKRMAVENPELFGNSAWAFNTPSRKAVAEGYVDTRGRAMDEAVEQFASDGRTSDYVHANYYAGHYQTVDAFNRLGLQPVPWSEVKANLTQRFMETSRVITPPVLPLGPGVSELKRMAVPFQAGAASMSEPPRFRSVFQFMDWSVNETDRVNNERAKMRAQGLEVADTNIYQVAGQGIKNVTPEAVVGSAQSVVRLGQLSGRIADDDAAQINSYLTAAGAGLAGRYMANATLGFLSKAAFASTVPQTVVTATAAQAAAAPGIIAAATPMSAVAAAVPWIAAAAGIYLGVSTFIAGGKRRKRAEEARAAYEKRQAEYRAQQEERRKEMERVRSIRDFVQQQRVLSLPFRMSKAQSASLARRTYTQQLRYARRPTYASRIGLVESLTRSMARQIKPRY